MVCGFDGTIQGVGLSALHAWGKIRDIAGMLVLAAALAFLFGSIPFSWLLVWLMRGVDIRTVGSGNPGATNAWRVMGGGWGSLALALDIAKGLLAVVVAPRVTGSAPPDWLPAVCGCFAILGNVFCPFLRFKGGKAVATAAGVFLGLTPISLLVTSVVFGGLVGWTRKISIGSLTAAVILPVVVTYQHVAAIGDNPRISVLVLVWAAAILVIARHLPNIKRLIRGEEKTFLKKEG
jgi:glycerol-3-phosphate acyltransferase PlsY